MKPKLAFISPYREVVDFLSVFWRESCAMKYAHTRLRLYSLTALGVVYDSQPVCTSAASCRDNHTASVCHNYTQIQTKAKQDVADTKTADWHLSRQDLAYY